MGKFFARVVEKKKRKFIKLILSKYINASYLFSLTDAALKISSYLYEKSSRNAESVKSTLF